MIFDIFKLIGYLIKLIWLVVLTAIFVSFAVVGFPVFSFFAIILGMFSDLTGVDTNQVYKPYLWFLLTLADRIKFQFNS